MGVRENFVQGQTDPIIDRQPYQSNNKVKKYIPKIEEKQQKYCKLTSFSVFQGKYATKTMT